MKITTIKVRIAVLAAAALCLTVQARAFWTDGGRVPTALDQLGLSADIDERYGTSGDLADIIPFLAAREGKLPDKTGGKADDASNPDSQAAAAIRAIAAREESPFGALNGGNRGLSAYRMTTRAANRAAWLVESSFPGINLGGKEYSDVGPQLILVITSDDEPAAHMYDQDRASGKLLRIAEFSITEACERLGSNGSLLEKIAPGADPDTLDWPALLSGLLGSGNSAPVPLGEGSAPPYWWQR